MVIVANITDVKARYRWYRRDVAAPDDERADVRDRILRAAAKLVKEGGIEAATTRAVAAAARVQAPTIYRWFGDKQGLLDAVAEHVVATYVTGKAAAAPHRDAVQDLKDGWDQHVAFGLAHPGLVAIMGRSRGASPAARAGMDVLQRRVQRLAETGQLRMPQDRAVALLSATGRGVVQSLLELPADDRDAGLSDAARDAVLAAMTGARPARANSGARGAAVALRANLDRTKVLSAGERKLLEELLDRIADEREG